MISSKMSLRRLLVLARDECASTVQLLISTVVLCFLGLLCSSVVYIALAGASIPGVRVERGGL